MGPEVREAGERVKLKEVSLELGTWNEWRDTDGTRKTLILDGVSTRDRRDEGWGEVCDSSYDRNKTSHIFFL